MADTLSTWDEVRRIADEIEVQLHLASMDARDRYHALQPRIAATEAAIVHSGEHASDAVISELHELRTALLHLRDQVYAHARGDFVTGW